jgi:hypothetical protein
MPLLLLKALPYLAAVAAMLAGVWYIDHLGYQRAQADQAKLEQKLTSKLDAKFALIDSSLHTSLGQIDTHNTTVVQPAITREINHEIRFTSPACALTDSMRAAINSSRLAATIDGGNTGAVSSPATTGR